MKYHPILFSGPMIRALLAGKKTQTRRVVSRANSDLGSSTWDRVQVDLAFPQADHSKLMVPDVVGCATHRIWPRWQKGDRLWVREGLRRLDDGDCASLVEYAADGAVHGDAEWVWKRNTLPGMFMPRGLSRITLEVTDVRLQRLWDISEEDAYAEGCNAKRFASQTYGIAGSEARIEYATLWDDINAKRAPWSSSPWVWAITFTVVTP